MRKRSAQATGATATARTDARSRSASDRAADGVVFVSMGENIDTSSPTGRILLEILRSFAEFERDGIRERIAVRTCESAPAGHQTRPPWATHSVARLGAGGRPFGQEGSEGSRCSGQPHAS
jgi:hypothetical protein